MPKKQFTLIAHISTESPSRIRKTLAEMPGVGPIRRVESGFIVEARMRGETARDLNRTLLSALRCVERRTRLRAEWSSGETTERFFDYVPKGTRRLRSSPSADRR